jgi:hypothetical protein
LWRLILIQKLMSGSLNPWKFPVYAEDWASELVFDDVRYSFGGPSPNFFKIIFG